MSVALGEDRNKNGEKAELTRIAHDGKTPPVGHVLSQVINSFHVPAFSVAVLEQLPAVPLQKLPLIQ